MKERLLQRSTRWPAWPPMLSPSGQRLFGAAKGMNSYLVNWLLPLEQAGLRAALGEERLAELWAESRAISFKTAVSYALKST